MEDAKHDQSGTEEPPTGNTGAELFIDGRRGILDWLRATLIGESVLEGLEIVRFLFGEITTLDRGFRGYASSGLILAGGGRVAWDDKRLDMGVHVDISARGLAEWARSEGGDVLGLLAFMWDRGFQFGRVDVAFDDHDGALNLGEMWQALEQGDYSSRWRKKNICDMKSLESGRTISFGSRVSDAYLRIYDKAAQQNVEGHWIRVELEFKRKRAHAMVEMLLSEGLEAVLGVLRGYLEFKEPGAGNITNRPAAAWWRCFLDGVAKARLVVPDVARTLESVRNWIDRQVAASIALVTMAEGGAVDWLYDAIRDGRSRLKTHQLALLPAGMQ